jgi:hypothetical protein
VCPSFLAFLGSDEMNMMMAQLHEKEKRIKEIGSPIMANRLQRTNGRKKKVHENALPQIHPKTLGSVDVATLGASSYLHSL